MNTPLTLRWVPPRVCESVQQGVLAALAAWCASWGLVAPTTIQVAPVDRNDESAPLPVSGLDLADHAALPSAWQAALVQALFGVGAVAQGSAMVPAVLSRCTDQLRSTVLSLFKVETATQAGPDTPTPHPGHHGLRLTFDLLGFSWYLRMPISALTDAGWLRLPEPNALPHWQPEKAMAHLTVPLQAVVGQVQVDVLNLMQLGQGDVIVLTQALDDPIRVAGCHAPLSTTLQLRAQLGAVAGQRAVQWLRGAATPVPAAAPGAFTATSTSRKA